MDENRTPKPTGVNLFFTEFSTWVAKSTGSHWAFVIAAVAVVAGLLAFGIEITNVAISVVTLLMVFVLQNTQNRDSAALHLKLNEVVRVEPEARDRLMGIETKSDEEIAEEGKEQVAAAVQPVLD